LELELSNTAATGNRAVLVHIDFRNPEYAEELEEFRQLAASSGLEVDATVTGSRTVPDSRFFVGSGKVEEIRERVLAEGANLVVFNHELSASQERNVERQCKCRVLDRVGLILDIFAQRARTYEGKLQVELAQLQHLSTRLVRGWSHLERQKGGIGLRGPGETQLETDRRLIGRRIKTIHARLERVRRQRKQVRRLRERRATPVVSLVGYTNAGKSTLFNRLTGAGVYAADKLFATLDPTVRRITIPPEREVVLTDTVGFIRHIPHDLVAAFHATLEEVREADLLLHVVDASAEQRHARMQQVDKVIDEIGAGDVPRIIVYNKIDSAPGLAPRVEAGNGRSPAVWLSAKTGEGVDALLELIAQTLKPLPEPAQVRIPADAGALRARLFRQGAVRSEQPDEEGGWVMQLEIDPPSLNRIVGEHGLRLEDLR
jgi:GTP-binding protein HflX